MTTRPIYNPWTLEAKTSTQVFCETLAGLFPKSYGATAICRETVCSPTPRKLILDMCTSAATSTRHARRKTMLHVLLAAEVRVIRCNMEKGATDLAQNAPTLKRRFRQQGGRVRPNKLEPIKQHKAPQVMRVSKMP